MGTSERALERYGKYHSDRLDEDRQKLMDYYLSQGFFEVKVTHVTRPRAEQGLVDLTFVISEGTRYSVRNVIIEGNTSITSDELRKDLELRSGKPFTRAMKEADNNRILLRYGAIDFVDAQIMSEHRFTSDRGVVDLVYKIEQNGPSFLFQEQRIRRTDGPKKR